MVNGEEMRKVMWVMGERRAKTANVVRRVMIRPMLPKAQEAQGRQGHKGQRPLDHSPEQRSGYGMKI